MFFIVLLLFSALAVSAVAGYFSIVGLMAIFPAAAYSILAMGCVLEIAKLVTASWVYRYWDKAAVVMKTYFTIAVIILSLITSMGIFGFLSRAHLEHTITVGGDNELQISVLERQIANERRTITDGENILSQLDATVQTLINYDRIRGGEGALAVRESQREERAAINLSIQRSVEKIEELSAKLTPLQAKSLEIELEVGPIKYIADMIYGETTQDIIDKAVRLIIVLLIFVFDPLAILLVIAANMSLREYRGENISFASLDDSAAEIEQIIETEPEPEPVYEYPPEPEPEPEPEEDEEENWIEKKYGKVAVTEEQPDSEIIETNDLEWLIDGKKNVDRS